MINSLIDATIANDELEMLMLRLEVLSSYGVRIFRVCESPTTHQGKSKPLHITENLKLLRANNPALDIDVYIVDIPLNLNPREAENHVRNRFVELLFEEFPEKSIIFCDVDEFPHFDQLTNYLESPMSVYSIHMKLSYLFGNLKHKGVPIFTYSKIGPSAQIVATRDVRWAIFPAVPGELGAHLSFCGFSEKSYLNKLASYGQPEFNVNLLNSPGYLDLTRELAIDPLARFQLRGKGILEYKPITPGSMLFQISIIKPSFFSKPTTHSLLSRLVCSADLTLHFLVGRYDTNGAELIKSNLDLSVSSQLIKLILLQIRIWLLKIRFTYRSRLKTRLYRAKNYFDSHHK